MEFSPNDWIGVFQLGMALFALVGGLILFVALILIGLNQPTITEEEEHNDDPPLR